MIMQNLIIKLEGEEARMEAKRIINEVRKK